MQDTDELTTEAIRERMDVHIAAASESAEVDPANIGLIDDLAAKFLDSLTPKEMGFLMYDNPQPLSLQEVDSDSRSRRAGAGAFIAVSSTSTGKVQSQIRN